MGYAVAISACFSCARPFGYNPHRVPSIRINGVREPICRDCMQAVNAKRKMMGFQPHKINADAYDPVDESEL